MTRISRAVSNTVSFSPSRAIETFPHMDLSGGGGGGATTSTFTVAASADNGWFTKDQYYNSNPVTSYSSRASGGSVVNVGVTFYSYQNKYRFRQVFFRFTNVTIPSGSTISTAKLKIDFLSGSERTFQINGYDADNVSQPSAGSDGNHTNFTTANASWTVPASEAVHDSPEIKTIVQEIIDRSGWASGNAMMFGLWLPTNEYGTYNRSLNFIDATGRTDPQLEITYS